MTSKSEETSFSHDEVQTTILWPLIMSNADIGDFQNC